MAGLVLPFSALTKAEVTLDGTLGPAGSLAGPNFVIPDAVGQTVGLNLFHSFSLFNINTGESATFTGPSSIENVLGRVTGGSSSFIDGLLRTQFENASPNLFLLNPAGVLFGPNASLDVQGSFHVSTADYLKLGEGGRFDATHPENSVLTTAPPEAFGFLGERQPAGIAFHGSDLGVPEGETLSVIGGDIEITGGTQLRAPGGRVNVASVASDGKVTLGSDTLATDSFARLGRIDMAQNSTIDVSGEGGGSVFIRGGQFLIDQSLVLSLTNGNMDGKDIDIQLTDELTMKGMSVVATSTSGPGNSGSIAVEAEDIVLEGSSSLTAMAQGTDPGSGDAGDMKVNAGHTAMAQGTDPGSGDAGDIKVNAGHLQLKGGSQINTITAGPGQGGTVEVQAENIVLEGRFLEEESVGCPTCLRIEGEQTSGLFAITFGSGSGGAIKVNAGRLQLKERANIAADTFGFGKGGNVKIAANSLRLEGGSQIGAATFGAEDAGKVFVEAENIILEGKSGEFESGLFVSAEPGATGDGGNLTIEAVHLRVSDGATITASTFGPGQGGNISIHATDIDLFDGGSIMAKSEGTGLDVENDSDAGHSGNINIWVSDTFHLFTGSQINVATTQADAGDITLEVGNLLHLSNGSGITTSVAGGRGDGGKITIGNLIAPTFVVLDGSQIVAKALAGHGGNIRITSDFFFKSPDSLVSAASGNPELSGTVVIVAPDTDIIAGLAELPANFLDAATALTQLCAERSGANVSSLVFRKYEVLPDSPYALRVQLPRAIPAPRTAKQSRTPRTHYAGSPLPPMISCLWNG
jgi:filamentous hemagglutinin family protein